MTRLKRALYRLSEILDYRTFVVATGFLALVIVGYLVVASLQQAHDATEGAQRRGTAATRRIDKLNAEILNLEAAIAQGRDQRGQLAAAVAVLSRQLAVLGVQPILRVSPGTTVIITSPPRPAPTASPRPVPRATPTRPRPTASPTSSPAPSPSPCLIPLLCREGA